MKLKTKSALVIGAGFGGISLAIRLQALGFETTLLEKLDKPGGRGYQKIIKVDGVEGEFKFDMGPTVLTVPHFIEELFAISKEQPWREDFPKKITTDYTQKYVKIVPINPFYRIYFSDQTFFDYDGDPESTFKQLVKLCGKEEAEKYWDFLPAVKDVFNTGFLNLGYRFFKNPLQMLQILPEIKRLKVIQSLDKYVKRFFSHPKARFIFSFETLLVGGNPQSVPALYAMIHLVETTWRVHYAIGGTGALVDGFIKKFQELGGKIKLNSEVDEILMEKSTAIGVRLKTGKKIKSNIVCSNADYGHTYGKLIKKRLLINNSFKVKTLTRYTNSLFVIYFGFKRTKENDLSPNLRHHNIITSQDFYQELKNIYKDFTIPKDFSQYLHIPTITDPSMAPKGFHTAYSLIVVPNLKQLKVDWSKISKQTADRIIDFLDQKNYIPNLKQRLVHLSWINPDYFEKSLNSFYGNAFGVNPILSQSAYFRPHNKSMEVKNLYCVGAGYQPGAGTPSVMMSAKMTAREVRKEFVKR